MLDPRAFGIFARRLAGLGETVTQGSKIRDGQQDVADIGVLGIIIDQRAGKEGLIGLRFILWEGRRCQKETCQAGKNPSPEIHFRRSHEFASRLKGPVGHLGLIRKQNKQGENR